MSLALLKTRRSRRSKTISTSNNKKPPPQTKHEQDESSFPSTLSRNISPFSPAASFSPSNGNDEDLEEEMDYYCAEAIAPPPPSGVRYVNIRVAIPSDSPSMLRNHTPHSYEDAATPSPMTVGSCFTPIPSSPFAGGSTNNVAVASTPLRSHSPYGFVPIPSRDQQPLHYPSNRSNNQNNGRSSAAEKQLQSTPPPASLYHRQKASPSTWTTITESTAAETPSGSTITTIDNMGSPVLSSFASLAPPLFTAPLPLPQYPPPRGTLPSPASLVNSKRKQQQQQQHSSGRDSPRPKTPTSAGMCSGRKSPFPQGGAAGRKSPFHHGGAPSSSPIPPAEEDLVRKTRIKTELCMHYTNGRPCPFGANCTYAHGEEELQMTKLLDLHNAGLVDLETFRCRPCFTWIATGSCPFGKRCTSIHDPRVQGSYPSWLTHTETQGNTIATDINVDGLFQKNANHVHHGTPFGDQYSLEHDSWFDLYRKVCNLDFSPTVAATAQQVVASDSSRRGGKNRKNNNSSNSIVAEPKEPIHALAKLKIALLMRGNDPDWQYKYRPKHVIHEELCMVLQKRAFSVCTTTTEKGNSSVFSGSCGESHIKKPFPLEVHEISVKTFKKDNPNHVLVYELAFGPDSDSQAPRPVSLWFNLDEQKIVECTSTQAKRFRWKRGINKNKDSSGSDGSANSAKTSFGSSTGSLNGQTAQDSAFAHLESFEMHRPHDEDAYHLVTDILKHRVAVLNAEHIPNMKSRHEAMQKTTEAKKVLQERFDNLVRHWTAWAWPINNGRQVVTKKTPVPPVEGPYKLPPPPPLHLPGSPSSPNDDDNASFPGPASDHQAYLGSQIHRVWDSFVMNKRSLVSLEDESCMDDGEKEAKKSHSSDTQFSHNNNTRLSIFCDLASGIEQDRDRSLPHIRSSSLAFNKQEFLIQKDSDDNDEDDTPSSKLLKNQQERCWKSILLPLEDIESGLDEWGLVREHFSNSRSKKVLTIIQQT